MQTWIGYNEDDLRGRRTRTEDEVPKRVRDGHIRIRECKRRALRRIEPHGDTALRENRLEDASMEDSVPAAEYEIALPAANFAEETVLPVRRVRETESRLYVTV